MSKVYFHIDLNAFFANAEVLLDPSLKGKPVVVSGNTRRSVVSTASYEARKYGIHSAMPLSEAEKKCPDLVIVNPHFTWYSELSEQFMDIVRSYTEIIEQASIDECYADMTEVIKRYERPLDLAWEIQKRALSELGLPCSIGVAPNMFLAKMASDMKKPLGITVLRIREVPAKLWPLPISDMRGIGSKTAPVLEDMGIHTIGDLANYQDIPSLRQILGKNTESVMERANGYDHREIVMSWDAKSMGVSETLLDDVTDYDEIRGLLRTLSRRLSKRMREEKKAGYTLSLRIRYYDFQNADRSKKLSEPIWQSDDIFVQALSLFDEHWEDEPVRLLGISMSDFASSGQLVSQIGLFDPVEAEKKEMESILKDLNEQLGRTGFRRASDLLGEKK